jgi:hypothetical protein
MKALVTAIAVLVIAALSAGFIGNAVHNDGLTVGAFVVIAVVLAVAATRRAARRGSAQGEE